MIYFSSNIKNLRKIHGFTQEELAKKLDLSRAVIGSYEEGRAVPRLAVLQAMAILFQVSVDDLLGLDFSEVQPVLSKPVAAEKKELRVFPVIVNENNRELVTVVPVKATAGYLTGYADPEFIETLPRFSLPLPELSRERTYRIFQIQGNSMLPVRPGSYIITDYVDEAGDVKEDQTYIIITREDGIVYKRIVQIENDKYVLKSDNPEYGHYQVNRESVMELWRALGYISFELPGKDNANIENLTRFILDVKNEINTLKNK